MSAAAADPLWAVLDDDPTGVQQLEDVPVLLRWERDRLARVAARHPRAIHLMTNVRAFDASTAYARTLEAVAAVREAIPDARIVLRGDSTLRGHVAEEYRAVREGGFGGRAPVLLLAPALPAAGRVTRDGVHWFEGPGGPVPLDRTEYAEDGAFAYRSARLLEWAEERSHGEIVAEDGTEVPLTVLRERGGEAVAEALAAAAGVAPAACAPDAETLDDLEAIAGGLRQAEAEGVEVVVRCAPTFAGVLAGTLASGLVPAPEAGEDGLLVVCGSYVSLSTRQLQNLSAALGAEPIELDVAALIGADPGLEVRRAAERVRARLSQGEPAILATPRQRPAGATSLSSGARVAEGLARVVAELRPNLDVVVAKGGITSQVVLATGLGAEEATVVGPVRQGVAQWRVWSDGREVSCLVCPGNVGSDELLTEVVGAVLGREATC